MIIIEYEEIYITMRGSVLIYLRLLGMFSVFSMLKSVEHPERAEHSPNLPRRCVGFISVNRQLR